MASSILSGTKNLWRKSVRQKESPYQSSTSDIGAKYLFEPVTLAIVGCGQRGKAYARYALECPDACKIVAIAEPRPQARKIFSETHSVDETLVFHTWKDLHSASAETIGTIGKRLADAVVITLQDHLHVEAALAFAEQGYHILCEKPMATDLNDCIRIEDAIKRAGIIFGMGHVMRYSPYSQEITKIVRSGNLGKLVNIVQVEPVGHYHFAHSFVRGNWAKEKNSSFSLLTKSCHDIDIICHWFGKSTPKKVSSFGSLQHFRPSGKPIQAGDSERCFDCNAEAECPYSAKRSEYYINSSTSYLEDIDKTLTRPLVYLDRVSRGEIGWPVSPLVDGIPDIENITAALKTGPYGRCVYESDNDVCDNQVVNLEFENGETASFTMVAFTSAICDRQLRMHFTHGEILGDGLNYTITDFSKRKTTTHVPKNEGGGHGGGDLGLIRAFVEAVRTGNQSVLGTDVGEVLRSHLTVFAAETSRREGTVVDCVLFEMQAREKLKEGESHTLELR